MPEVRRICRNISIIDDAFYEDPENFEVSLSTTDPSVMIDPTRQTGEATIVDNDGKVEQDISYCWFWYYSRSM